MWIQIRILFLACCLYCSPYCPHIVLISSPVHSTCVSVQVNCWTWTTSTTRTCTPTGLNTAAAAAAASTTTSQRGEGPQSGEVLQPGGHLQNWGPDRGPSPIQNLPNLPRTTGTIIFICCRDVFFIPVINSHQGQSGVKYPRVQPSDFFWSIFWFSVLENNSRVTPAFCVPVHPRAKRLTNPFPYFTCPRPFRQVTWWTTQEEEEYI